MVPDISDSDSISDSTSASESVSGQVSDNDFLSASMNYSALNSISYNDLTTGQDSNGGSSYDDSRTEGTSGSKIDNDYSATSENSTVVYLLKTDNKEESGLMIVGLAMLAAIATKKKEEKLVQ